MNVMRRRVSRGASARSAARIAAALAVALVALLAVGRDAFAEVDWHEKGANMSATVSPWSYPEGREYALAEFLGYDWTSLSNEVRDLIVTDSNGDNAFNQILEHNVLNVQYESGEGALNWPIIGIWSQIFGLDKCWDISVTNDRYVAAQEVMRKYMFPREGEQEPGQDASDGRDYEVSFTLDEIKVEYAGGGYPVFQCTFRDNGMPNQGALVGYLATSQNKPSNYIYIDKYSLLMSRANRGFIYSLIANGYDVYAGIQIASTPTIYYFAAKPGTYELSENQANATVTTATQCYSWISRGQYNVGGYLSDGVCFSYTDFGSPNVINATSGKKYQISPNSMNSWGGYAAYFGKLENGGTVSEPYEPVPKPDPERPIIQVGDVTIDLSNGPVTINNVTYELVYAPDNSWSVQIKNDNSKTYGGDVVAGGSDDTDILNAILQAINTFRREVLSYYNDIDADLTSMQNSLGTALKNVETTLKNAINACQNQLHQDIQTLQTNLQSTITGKWDGFATDLWKNMGAFDSDVIEEMGACAQFIVDNVSFDGGTFDDGDIIKWLKLIYGKIRKGPSGIRDPTEDPHGWFDDIEKQLRKLLETIFGAAKVAELVDMFQQLSNHFPISIPWDVVAIITLFGGEPVTPNVQWPVTYAGQTTYIGIDLSPYEDVADISRKVSVIAFAMLLIMHHKDLMGPLESLTRKRG